MHESALAASVADAVRRLDLERSTAPIRLTVYGGHTAATAFDDALLLHLAMQLPSVDSARISIVHAPRRATCLGCGASFETTAPDGEISCPTCEAPGLVRPTPESIELEWEDEPCA